MQQISKLTAGKFCEICNWTFEVWITHRTLFEDNPNPQNNIEKFAPLWERLNIVTQEYVLQQISKLHDPVRTGKDINLSLEYILKFGCWPSDHDIHNLYKKLQYLWDRLKTARNKLLSHHDLKAVIAGVPLGAFDKDADIEYFTALQEFVNIVHDRWEEGPYPFNDLAKQDVKEFLAALE